MLNENKLLETLKEIIEEYDFTMKFNEFLQDYFSKYQIYKHIHSIERFIGYNGRIYEDTSGEIESFNTDEELIDYIKNEYEPCEYIDDHILGNLYNGQKEASYCSGCGWNFITIKDELERYFDEIKYDLYNDFIMQNKKYILNIFNLSYDTEQEFKDNIFDDLDDTSLSDYMVTETYEIFISYLETIKEGDIIKIIKNK